MKYLLLILSIFFCLVSYSQNKYAIEVESSHIIEPFNRFNLFQTDLRYYDIDVRQLTSYSYGLGIKRKFGSHTLGIKYRYFYSGFEVDYEIIGRGDEVLFKEDWLFVFNNSVILGINYAHQFGRLKVQADLNMLSFEKTRKYIFQEEIPYSASVYRFYNNNNVLGIGVTKIEEVNINRFTQARFAPEISIGYEISKSFYINAGMFLQFWGDNEAYRLQVIAEVNKDGENVPRTDGPTIVHEIILKDRLVAPHIGISYNFGFGKGN